ncbi:MAG: hypothetical protein WDN04_12975 [Rhodospirillales bacterium]
MRSANRRRLPSRRHRFFSRLLLTNGAPVSAGPIKGTLGVTNLTFSNFNNTAVKVFVFLPVFVSGGVCGSPVIGGGSPGGYFMIGANQTLTIPYPTPQVYTGLPSCLAANITSGGFLPGGAVRDRLLRIAARVA